jgi:hypothetical protein
MFGTAAWVVVYLGASLARSQLLDHQRRQPTSPSQILNAVLPIDPEATLKFRVLIELLNTSRRPSQLVSRAAATMHKAPSAMNSLRTAIRVSNNTPCRRYVSDITITRTGKPIIRTQGGRLVTSLVLSTQRILTHESIDLLLEVI